MSVTGESWVLAFADCSAETADRVGGKALGLGELERQGFPVPAGFAVTTDAYRAAVAPIASRIADILKTTGTPEADAAASEHIEALFTEDLIPDTVWAPIAAAYEALGGKDAPVAVRSSATAEDTADASFAGQQETYLWVCGAAAVKRHLVRCWASLFSDRAIAYRARMGVDVADLAMGVVIQKMVPAEAAGVMMTLNPVTGDRSAVYVESAFGLGEIVVRGEVEPDRFHIDKAEMTLRSQVISTKAEAYRFVKTSGEVRRVAVAASQQKKRSLSADEVLELAELGRRIEAAFGRPMDVEWAIAVDSATKVRSFAMLQARPETVWANRAPDENPADVIGRRDPWDPIQGMSGEGEFWTTSNIGEAAPGVQTPLSWTVWWPGGEDSQREAAYQLGVFSKAERKTPVDRPAECFNHIFYGRLAMRVAYLAILGDRMPGTTGPATVESLFGRVPEGMPFHPTDKRHALIIWRLLYNFITVPGRLKVLGDETTAWWQASLKRVPDLNRAEATALFVEARDRFVDAQTMQVLAVISTVQPLFVLLDALAKQTGIARARELGGVSGNQEMAVVRDLWRMSRDQIGIHEAVAEHGFHGPAEGELSSRVWREDPSPLIRMADQYRGRGEAVNPMGREAEQARDRDAIEREVLAAVPWWQRGPTRMMLGLARKYLPLRGVAKCSFLQGFDVARACARRLGDLLTAEGLLSRSDDVFYLTVHELTLDFPSDARELVAKRRARRAAYQGLRLPGNWEGVPDVQPIPPASDDRPVVGAVHGIGVSRGIVEGRVRVLMQPDFAEVEADDILVAPTTDPSWSSIMFISSAIVVDIGGALSHAAVVAREMNIPCVVNTRTGTASLRTGDRVRVDGATGTVEVLERAA